MPTKPRTLQAQRPSTPVVQYADQTAANRQRSRTLATNSTAWRQLRARVLAAEPLCKICWCSGIQRAATHVDHVDADASNNDLDNLQPLCARCHSRKTAAEDGGFGNAIKDKVK